MPDEVELRRASPDSGCPGPRHHGFTLIELVVAAAIVLTVAAILVPNLRSALEAARIARAVADIRTLESEIGAYELATGSLPRTLADLGRSSRDPWGAPYQYLNFAEVKGKGQMRKDRFLVPLNTAYDLYSVGKDGKSAPALTAGVSQDDIIRANDGAYVGLASQY
ncbi:MAG: prepilin-type N-terminal cleavage/methylation domain-containing protein [Armatimonadota bacterium]|nr:prepilin-type N-terminal cleavage/methylation domain-containing protein [Armatimonadota bacterium]MDR7452330.1 prepilin-type N-terminal cleavage/methylation domain-containing protein [Armatimonadota bacterium]MDR7467779.1 prepilin-type N-terminal cleavage/methylation domain-containing protein [Armatimonadota bacterium]MDR7494635.1 prepilin-type N-terminal cleavage/methylation domain-containing protein [Armatimonadota bacterium]MDR7499695.1 prepilin-type N-terminal cleavage/methylation domain